MSYLTEQIELEKKKIALFQAGIENCNKRIKKLESLEEGDELDTFVSSMISTPLQLSNNDKTNVDENTAMRIPKKRIADKTITILRHFGKEGKSLKDTVAYSIANKIGLNENNIRNLAMIYKNDFGYLESPSRGFYKLTELGQNAVK